MQPLITVDVLKTWITNANISTRRTQMHVRTTITATNMNNVRMDSFRSAHGRFKLMRSMSDYGQRHQLWNDCIDSGYIAWQKCTPLLNSFSNRNFRHFIVRMNKILANKSTVFDATFELSSLCLYVKNEKNESLLSLAYIYMMWCTPYSVYTDALATCTHTNTPNE